MNPSDFIQPQNTNDDYNSLETIVALEEPDRTNRIRDIIKNTEEKEIKQKWEFILERIKLLGIHAEGFFPEEIIDF